MAIDLFDARMLNPLVSFLDRSGDRSESFTARARIPGELIAAGGWITKKQAYDFTADVVRRSGCSEAVFSAYLRFEFGHLGPIEAAMKSCKTVKESLEVGARLGSCAYEGNEYFLKTEGDTTWFCYREPDSASAGRAFIDDMTLTVYYRLVRALIDEDWRPERIRLRRQMTDRHRRVEAFRDCRAEIHLDHTALGFPTEFLSRHIPTQLPADATDERKPWLSQPDGSGPIVGALYRLVASRFPFRKLPTLDQLAIMVGVSAATLKRQLGAEGVTYRGVLDRLRFDTACEMLAVPQITVREIANDLGYSGTNNFVRAFRRMTGLTPGDYRRQQSGDNGR